MANEELQSYNILVGEVLFHFEVGKLRHEFVNGQSVDIPVLNPVLLSPWPISSSFLGCLGG